MYFQLFRHAYVNLFIELIVLNIFVSWQKYIFLYMKNFLYKVSLSQSQQCMLAQQCCFSINVHILLILYIHKTEKNVFLCLLNYQEDISSTSLVTLNSKKHPISTVLPNVLTVLLFPIKWFLFKNTKYSSINKSLDIGQYVSNISLMKAGSPLVNCPVFG